MIIVWFVEILSFSTFTRTFDTLFYSFVLRVFCATVCICISVSNFSLQWWLASECYFSKKKCNNCLLLGSWPAQCEERMPVQEGLHVVILPAIYLECCEPETFRIAHETWCLLYDCVAVGQFQCFLEVMLICQWWWKNQVLPAALYTLHSIVSCVSESMKQKQLLGDKSNYCYYYYTHLTASFPGQPG